MQSPVIDPLVVIVGPTGVGKTKLAFEVACQLDGEIISADSRLFYRGMDIGTAKPSSDMRAQICHHLIDFAEPQETVSIKIFQQKVEQCIQDIFTRQRLPILVGGTGQYIWSIVEGWSIPPQKPDVRIRSVLLDWEKEISPKEIHEKLRLIDPEAADKIDYRNIRRTLRALEVILGTGRLFSEQRRKIGANYSIKMIGITMPRPQLYQQIDLRIEQMMESGLIAEVESLLAKGLLSDLPSMSAIGYREVIEFIKGDISSDEAVQLIKRRTRQLVRRQANWFKLNDPRIHWFSSSSQLVEEVVNFIKSDKGWLCKLS